MAVQNTGLNKMRDLMNTNVTICDWGTGTTDETANDTGLETEVAGLEVTTTNATVDKGLQSNGVLVSTSGNGNSISEAVFRFSDSTHLSRYTFVAISKTSAKEIHTIQSLVFTRG